MSVFHDRDVITSILHDIITSVLHDFIMSILHDLIMSVIHDRDIIKSVLIEIILDILLFHPSNINLFLVGLGLTKFSVNLKWSMLYQVLASDR